MNYRYSLALAALLIATSVCLAQAADTKPAPPVSYSSISELNQLVGNLQQTSQQMQDDLSRLRIEKWKTDSGTKQQTSTDVESIQRNLQAALPGILSDLKNSPESTPVTFKLYRNLDALYDVTSSVVESAGAFGSRDEFESLNRDLESLEHSRHAFADRIDKIATAKETEIGQLRAALQTARAETPPKKTVVDDTEPVPAKKPAPRKKAPAKPKSATQPSTPAQQPPQPPAQAPQR
jgi:hypothetical protein